MVIGVTGHRPKKLGGFQKASALRVVEFATSMLEQIAPDLVMSGMGQGWDIAVVKGCIKLGIPFEAAVPFQGQEATWPDFIQNEYHRLLAKAQQVHYVCDPGYAVYKLMRRNEFIVDWIKPQVPDGAFMLAMFDGSQNAGGTSQCVEYAASKAVPVENVWSIWQEFLESIRQGAANGNPRQKAR